MSEFIEEEFEEETWVIRPNKSQIKRDISVVHDLCEEILQLAPAQIERLDLPDNILIAMLEAAKMPFKGARKRQLKFITSLMRKIDLDPIQEKIDKIKAKSAHASRELHQLEKWRERLLSDDKQAITDFITQHSSADAQLLRQFIRNSKQELEKQKPPKSSRALFRYLREIIEAENTSNDFLIE